MTANHGVLYWLCTKRGKGCGWESISDRDHRETRARQETDSMLDTAIAAHSVTLASLRLKPLWIGERF